MRPGLRSAAERALALGACMLLAEQGHRHAGLAFGGLLPLALGLVALSLLARLRPALGTPCPRPAASAGWAQRVALLAMLPMMAGLPWLADACSSAGWPLQAAWALHLAVMVLPTLTSRPHPAAPALLLLAGGAALLTWPGVQGLMTATLLHGAAWGLAAGAARPGDAPGLATSAWSVALLLALGLAVDTFGLHALVVAHAVLALLGLLGLMALTASASPARARRHNPAHARHRHP